MSNSEADKNAPLPRMSKKTATEWAQQFTADMANVADVTLDEKTADVKTYQCVGKNDEIIDDGRYDLYYTVYSHVPTDQHTTVVQKLRDKWKAMDYEISGYREYQDDYNDALVGAINNKNGFTVSAGSAGPAKKPSKLILFSVRTPCMMPPDKTQETASIGSSENFDKPLITAMDEPRISRIADL